MPQTDPMLDIPKELISHFLNLEEIWRAVAVALGDCVEDASEVVLRAAGAMHVNASDFDRGMAAGFALARHIDRVRAKNEPRDDNSTMA